MAVPGVAVLKSWADRSPLTDPKSITGSVVFHLMLLLIASVAALGVSRTDETERPRVLQGELDPVDNQAKPEGEGGGAPGPLGPERLAAALEPVAPPSGSEPNAADAPPAPAEALLSEILPTQSPATDVVRQALPGPSTSIPSMTAPPGRSGGGGGGSGGGSGGGVGRGIGPGTEFFGARENASSYAYVIDCSGSMATRGSLDVAKRELANSLGRLPPDARFAVVFYNLYATVFSDPLGRRGMMAATADNKRRVDQQLARIVPDGGTEHMLALRAALALRPEVIFFLTDADLMTQTDAMTVVSEANGTRIQAVEFGRGMNTAPTNPLQTLAVKTGGSYRYIDVTAFPRPR